MPYRVGAKVTETDFWDPWQTREWDSMTPACPGCGYVGSPLYPNSQPLNATGKICHGRRSFWTRAQLCPEARPHYHPTCRQCKYTWIMRTKLG